MAWREWAVTTVLAYVILVSGTWYALQRFYPISYDWLRVGRVTVLATAVVVVTAVASPDDIATGSACAVLGWAVFVGLLIKTRVIDEADVAIVKRRLRGRQGSRGASRR